jgi:hypothetical protein
VASNEATQKGITMTVNTTSQEMIDNQKMVMQVRTIAPDAVTATLATNAATLAAGRLAVQVTTEALTTAGAASQAFVLTVPGVTTTDLVFLTVVGGTNTTRAFVLRGVCTANTVTVTLDNITAATALNGTIIFNAIIMKA